MTATSGSDARLPDEAVVQRIIELIGTLDVAGVMELITDDFALEFPFRADGGPRRLEGDAARRFLQAMPKLFTRMDMHDIVVHGSTSSGEVVAEYRSNGLTKADRAYPNVYVGFLTIRHGKVALWREYFDPNVVAAAFPSV
jgi:ketosteroid isomerase-like protein